MPAGIQALLAVPRQSTGSLIGRLRRGSGWQMKWLTRRREARMALIEAELDHTQQELRRTILQLADVLGIEAHEARKALIRESFLASGRTPDRH